MFRLLIVEDEENSRKGLKATLAPYRTWKSTLPAMGGKAA